MQPGTIRILSHIGRTALLVCALLLAATPADARRKNKAAKLYTATGEASYYADKFNGRTTASGEKFSNSKLTAAHRTLPFGTMVRVTYLKTGKSVTVRINDRGPQKKSRIIDLSRKAADQIGMTRDGVGQVRVEQIK